MNGKANSKDEYVGDGLPPEEYTLPQVYFDTLTDKTVMNKQCLLDKRNQQYNFMHNVNGVMQADYMMDFNSTDQYIHFGFRNKPDEKHKPKVTNLSLNSNIRPVSKFFQSVDDPKTRPLYLDDPNYPSMGPQFYTIKSGDTLDKIAQEIFGEKETAKNIARENGLLSTHHVLEAGQIINLPQYFPKYNRAENNKPYHQFINIIVGRLSPLLITPKPKEEDDDILGQIIKIIAVAVVIATAPQLAEFVLGALEISAGVITSSVATGIVAALGDAAIQGVAIGLDMQSKFSITEVLETGVGVGVGISISKIKNLTELRAIAAKALAVGSSVTATQLIEMKAGLRGKFDLRAVALQVSSTILSAGIHKGVTNILGEGDTAFAVDNVTNTSVNALIGHAVTGAPINIQNIAANMIGSTIGKTVADKLRNTIRNVESTESKAVTQLNTSNHDQAKLEIEKAEAITQFQLDDPILNLPKDRYGEINYQLSEVNRIEMNAISAGFIQGFLAAAKDDIKSLYIVVSHPMETAKALRENFEENLNSYSDIQKFEKKFSERGNSFFETTKEVYNDFRNKNFYSLGRTTERIFDNVLLTTPILGVNKFGIFSRLAMGKLDEELIVSRAEYLNNKYGHLTRQERQFKIDKLSGENYTRRLSELIEKQEHIFRYLSEEGLKYSINSGNVRGYVTTLFSNSSSKVARGVQILPEWGTPQYGVAIPTNKLNGFQLARPFGNQGKIGWEIVANSYPSAGAGGWTQFLINPVNIDDVYIYRLQS